MRRLAPSSWHFVRHSLGRYRLVSLSAADIPFLLVKGFASF